MQPTAPQNDVVCFGVFEADLRSGELRKNGAKVKIQELPFRALKLLLSRPNEVLSREEFRKELWPGDIFVDFDHGISSAINRLRDALGDSADNPILVETLGRRGYRWIAPIRNSPSAVEVSARIRSQIQIQPEPQNAAQGPASLSPRWKWIWVLPALALLLVAWSFRPTRRTAKAGAAPHPTSSALLSGSPHRPANPEAEDFYLKGRFYWSKRTPDSLGKAVDAFTQAIVHDPNYAQAYVGLADSYNLLREYTVMPASEASRALWPRRRRRSNLIPGLPKRTLLWPSFPFTACGMLRLPTGNFGGRLTWIPTTPSLTTGMRRT
jgi:DNA-binding winged helix-turn-helix (wHTH) protein